MKRNIQIELLRNVWLFERCSKKELEAIAKVATPLDLSSRESIAAAIAQTVRQFGGVDIVVNTAAIYPTPESGGAVPESA